MKEKEAYLHIRTEIYNAIEEIRKSMPEAADYLSKNILFNDKYMTVKYIGDDRISLTKLVCQ